MARAVVVGGSSGIGLAIAGALAARGEQVVVAGRDAGRAAEAAGAIGAGARGIALDLAAPDGVAAALDGVERVDHLVVTAVDRGGVTLRDLDTAQAIRSLTIKLVGAAEVVRVLHPRFAPGASVVMFGGLAKDRPYPGSTMVSTFNAGVTGLIRTLAVEIAPHRVNAVHPGVVGDSPRWAGLPTDPILARTPAGRLVTMDDVVAATCFLLDTPGMNAHDLVVDGGFTAV